MASPEGQSSVANQSTPQLSELSNWTPKIANKWSQVLIQLLGDKYAYLKETIRESYINKGCEACCDKMFEEWCNLFPHRTWNDLITALKSNSVRKDAVALEIEAKYCVQPITDPQQQKQPQLIATTQEHSQQRATVPASQPVEHQTDVTGMQHLQGNNEVNDEVDDDGNQQSAPPQQKQPDPMNKEPFVNDKKMTEEMLNKKYTEKRKAIKPLGNVETKVDLGQKVANLEDYKYLIEVVNDVEFKTVTCEMEGEIYKCTVCDDFTKVNTTYWYGKWKKVPIVVVRTAKQDGTQFQFGSWFETKKALYYMPKIKYVFGVGVCGAAVDVDDSGIEKPRALKGHVVVSTHINGYDHQKKAEHDQNRSYSIDCRQSNFYHHLNETDTKHEWDKGLKFGKILSGSWLIANIEAQKSLLNLYQKDEIAFEMEGVGIAAACQNNTNVECCLVIKGVSDYANSKKDDGWQPAAARNAARYLSDMINKKEFPVDNEP